MRISLFCIIDAPLGCKLQCSTISLPVPGPVPMLLVSAICQGMNNTAPRLSAESKMRHTSGSKHSTLAPEHAPVKTGNYSPTAAAMAIKLVGEKVYEMKKFE